MRVPGAVAFRADIQRCPEGDIGFSKRLPTARRPRVHTLSTETQRVPTMQYVPNVCLATVITVQYVLLYGLYEYVREIDVRCTSLQEAAAVAEAAAAAATAGVRFRRDVNIAENSVMSSKTKDHRGGDEAPGEKVEFINPNLRPIVEKEIDGAAGPQSNGTAKEQWYWLNAYSRIPVSTRLRADRTPRKRCRKL